VLAALGSAGQSGHLEPACNVPTHNHCIITNPLDKLNGLLNVGSECQHAPMGTLVWLGVWMAVGSSISGVH
jgi:hypothetical protein